MNNSDREGIQQSSNFTRRSFLKASAALGTFALTTPASRLFGAAGANNRLRIAVAGLNGRGNSLMNGFAREADVEIAWLVDPDERLLASRGEAILNRTGRKPKTTADVRHALDDPEVDALVVATPNHWHSLMVIWAAQAGKHCYVEKPASHDLYEGRIALEMSKRHNVVVQHGTQRRSQRNYADLIEAIHAGVYGKLTVSHAFACKPREGIGHEAVSPPPDWLDWNMWRGPATMEEFHANLVHYNWHWFWETGDGELNNQGTHQLDVAYWALDPSMHGSLPRRAMSLGGRFAWDDQAETPNSMFSVAEYPNGQKVVMNIRNVDYEDYDRQVENRYYFEDGGRIIGSEYIAPDGEKHSLETKPADITPGGNLGSFLSACRAGDPAMANGTMADGHFSSALGHVMNISYRLGEPQPFNLRAGRFGDDSTVADEFLAFHEILRDGVGVPEDEEMYHVGPWLTVDSKSERFVGEHADRANQLIRNPRRDEFELPELPNV